jgi:hypothetical protein
VPLVISQGGPVIEQRPGWPIICVKAVYQDTIELKAVFQKEISLKAVWIRCKYGEF